MRQKSFTYLTYGTSTRNEILKCTAVYSVLYHRQCTVDSLLLSGICLFASYEYSDLYCTYRTVLIGL